MGVCRPVLQIVTLFQTKTCHFPNPLSDRPLKSNPFSDLTYMGLNYVTIANRTPTTDLLKFSSNDLFWVFLFLSYSFRVEKTNTLIRSRGSLENHTRFQTIMVKIYTHFQRPKRLKNYTLWGGTSLHN